MLAWYVPVLLKILISNGLASIMIKKNVMSTSRTKRFLVQFLLCTGFTAVISLFSGRFQFSYMTGLIVLVGFFNGFAAYCQWKAIEISLSKNSLFTFWDDIIAMTLAWVILAEGRLLNSRLILGTCISLISVCLFTGYEYKKKKGTENERSPFIFLIYVGIYSFIWGVAVFLIRCFTLKNIGVFTFLPAWYFGASIAAVIIRFKMKDSEKNDLPMSVKDFISILILSMSVFSGLGAAFLSYQSAPLVIAQPLFLVGEMIIPALLGLYLFKEIKYLDFVEKGLFCMAALGSAIIFLNF